MAGDSWCGLFSGVFIESAAHRAVTRGRVMPEDELADCWKVLRATGDMQARNRLIEHYQGFSQAIAASVYRLRRDDSVEFADYRQYAMLGLMQAIDRFDPQRERPFRSFAARRVRGAIFDGLGKESEFLAQRAFHAERRSERLRSLRQAGQATDQLERLADLTVCLALSTLLDEEDEELVDESVTGNPYAKAEQSQLARRIWAAAADLPERERAIIMQHYGDGMAFQDIALQLGVSKGRVSQLHGQALGRLRVALTAHRDQLRVTL
jgi:RNA polymerase sigma factor for flagellar operon FliA